MLGLPVQFVAAIRVLITARAHMSDERTAAVNALTAHQRVSNLGMDARRTLTATQIASVTTLWPKA